MQSSQDPSQYLSGQTAAITGGAGELCGKMADELGALGVNIVIIDINEERAAQKAKSIEDAGGSAMGICADVTDKKAMDEAASKIEAHFGGLHILINGAGGNHPDATTSPSNEFFDLPAEAIRKVFELNCLGTIIPSQALAPLILKTIYKPDTYGNIINLSSMNAFRPLTRIPAYSAAKAAVSNFTQWLSVHMAHNYTTRLRVNAIAPGFFLTEQNRFLLIDEKTGEYTDRGKTIIAHSPSGEIGRADQLISTLLWLLAPGSDFVNGIVVPVDGGFSAFSGV